MLTVGLVVEGPHDLVMLEPIIAHQIHISHNMPVQFRRLQPFPDAVGKLSSGGWPRVLAWCRNNSGTAIGTFFEPLFAGDPPCDVIIIHLDGDVIEHMSPHIQFKLPTPPISSVDRANLIHRALEGWLSVTPERRSKIAFAVPVLQSEAWILASEGSDADIENIDAKTEFRQTWNHKTDGPLGKYYIARVEATKKNFINIQTKCVSYEIFRTSIENLRISSK